MNNIIDQLFQKVQALGDNFTSNTYQALSSAMGPVFTLMLTLYLILWGYQFWQGRGGGSGAAMAFRLFRVAVIYALAIGWGDFQTFVYNAASDIPTSVGNIIVQNIGGSGTTGTDASQIEQSLSNVYLTGVDAASKLTSHAGWTNAGPYIYGALVWVAVALFVGFAAFLVIYAKIMLWVLLSLAPVFITLLLFNVTSRYFNGWLSALVQFVILPVLVYTLLGFFLTIMKDAVQTLNDVNGSAGTTLKEIAPVVLAAFIGFFIMTQTISLSALIAGGSHLGLPRFSPMAAMAWRQSGGRVVNLGRNSYREIAAATGGSREGRALAVRRDYVDTQFRALQDRRTAIQQQLKNR